MLIFLVFCVVFFVLFVLCLVHPVLTFLWIVHSGLPLRFSLTFIIIIDSLYSLIASSKVKLNSDIRNHYVLII